VTAALAATGCEVSAALVPRVKTNRLEPRYRWRNVTRLTTRRFDGAWRRCDDAVMENCVRRSISCCHKPLIEEDMFRIQVRVAAPQALPSCNVISVC
jgi:hypothetical protein